MMKRIAAILMVFIVLLVMVMNPVLTGQHTMTYALTNNQRLAAFSPAFWAWQATQWSVMGMQAQNLNEAIDYANRNGNIDDYLQESWSRFQQEVTTIPRTVDTYFRVLANFWQDLFDGNNEMTGVKDWFSASLDPQSPYYNDPTAIPFTVEGYHGLKIESQESPTNYIMRICGNNWINVQNWIRQYDSTDELDLYTMRFYQYLREDGYHFWRVINKNTSAEETLLASMVGFGTHYDGFIPMLNWKYSDGHTDANGVKYQMHVVTWFYGPGMSYVNWYSTLYSANVPQQNIVNDPVVTFNTDVMASVVTDEDASSGYVDYYLDQDYIDQVAQVIQGIGTGSATATDISMPDVDDYTIVTDVPAIAEVVNVVPNVAVENPALELPQVEQYKLPYMITTKFPFSIPWDIQRAFQMMQATPVVPHFEIPFEIPRLGIQEAVVIDLGQFSTIAKIFRWFTLASFILALIVATRSLIKG